MIEVSDLILFFCIVAALGDEQTQVLPPKFCLKLLRSSLGTLKLDNLEKSSCQACLGNHQYMTHHRLKL